MTQVKICGLTRAEEIKWILEENVAYFGMVLFFPKSRRNNSMENARRLLAYYREECGLLRTAHGQAGESITFPKAVAVTVSPTPEQIQAIEEAGFDMIQIHGELSKEAFDAVHIPIIRAFNVTDMEAYEKYHACPKVAAYLFDAKVPGSGQAFDWELLKHIPRDEKMLFLAGGLDSMNVREAIEQVHPDVVDVSSGVEEDSLETENKDNADKRNAVRKDRAKIKEFVRKVAADE